MKKLGRLLTVSSIALFVGTALWSMFIVPMNMDEAVPFHVVACDEHPNSHWHTFREGCDGKYELTSPLGFSYTRAFRYVGGLSSLLYRPIYHLSTSPAAILWLGLFYYLLFVLALSRSTSRPWMGFFVFLPFFPSLFLFIHDTGPIRFSALTFVLAPLVHRCVPKPRRATQILAGIAVGVLLGLATEDKIYFLFLLLPLALFALALTHTEPGYVHPFVSFVRDLRKGPVRDAIRKLAHEYAGWPYLISLLVTATITIGSILLSRVADGRFYIIFVLHENVHQERLILLNYIREYLLLWPVFTRQIYPPEEIYFRELFQIGVIGLLWASYRALQRTSSATPGSPWRSRLLVLSFLSLVVETMVSGAPWAGHHLIFMWIPLLVLFADLLSNVDTRQARRLTAFYLALNAACVWTLFSVAPFPVSSQERDRILAYFETPEMTRHALVNYSNIGEYHIHALTAPRDALVTYIHPSVEGSAEQLYAVSLSTNRQIYNVCLVDPCSTASLNALFRHRLHFREVDFGLKFWHVFEGLPVASDAADLPGSDAGSHGLQPAQDAKSP